jgi:3D (Asp-Asp-Asp) domain-containing protein
MGPVFAWHGRGARSGVVALAVTAVIGGVALVSAAIFGAPVDQAALLARANAPAPQPSDNATSPATPSNASRPSSQAADFAASPVPAAGASASPTAQRTERRFAGRPIEKARTIEMEVTAYSPGVESCGKWADGQTASGYSVQTNGGHLVAADTDLLPFGTLVTVPGYHDSQPVPVLDRGGAIKGKRLDVLFPTHQRALQWGRRTVEVTVWRYAD